MSRGHRDQWPCTVCRNPPSPVPSDPVAIEYGIDRHHHKIARKGLGNEHSIKGIAVRSGQLSRPLCVGDADCQFIETLAGDAADNIVNDGFTLRQPSEPVLGRNLPGGCRAYGDVVRLVRNDSVRSTGETLAVCKPPEKRMSIQKHPHGYLPSHASISSTGKGSQKLSGMTTFPFRTSGRRRARGLQPTSRTTGSPRRAMTTSSPASTLASNRESCVLA